MSMDAYRVDVSSSVFSFCAGGGGQGATIIQMKLQIANKHSGIQIQTSICGYDTGPLQENV